MSNEVTTKFDLSTIQGDLDDDTRAVAGTAFGKRISIRGGLFRKIANGKEVGSIEERSMDVIFVKMAHNPARTFYTQVYKEGEAVAPDCWSSDTKYPDAKVEKPQAASCTACPQSVSGTGNQGQGTACRLQWRTAIVLPQDPSGDVMQLVLPATSVFGKEDNGKWPFRPYVQMLAANNISAGRVITKMQFDTKSAVPKLLFSPTGAVSPIDLPKVEQQAKSDAAANAIDMNIFKRKENAVPEVAQPVIPPQPKKEISEQPELPLTEPILRKTEKSETKAPADVPEILKKWGKPKQ